ncbi:xanthine dehydrogenase family protein molybdopterin-binding subunit [Nonomuraea basaltis]|uniref:xanthine dehydrogenase family protein molybdopterin-binding subunit n=1 Tax=Nonomuraea basaltis TaxID=2495887 RepID=UPI00110C590E|nr:xanthine dehydrogenase family protein molybdopterin-binding subunit [Nonomuraea basaltis]TMR97156.1 xanthine dehydrogenase family protein molybdopterin-binding subunit [Nonomuraea basaltis]
MSITSRAYTAGSAVLGKLSRLLPDGRPDPLAGLPGEIGRPADRLDGLAKATGGIRYTAEHDLPGLTHAVVVGSTIAKGRVTAVHTAEAAAAPGVVLVMTEHNAPRMKRTPAYATLQGPLGAAAMTVPVLNTDEIFWTGQPIAVVVAETLEQAEHAAALVHADYEIRPAALAFPSGRPYTPAHAVLEEPVTRRGDTKAALSAAAATVEAVYATPLEYHNAMEPHATIAHWEGDRLTVFDASQYPYGVKEMLAKKFGLPKKNVRVLAPYIGGGFGSKTCAWPHVSLAVAAARLAGRPVKLALTRAGMFTMTGGRAPTRSRVALGADATGRLTALEHDALAPCTGDEFAEAAAIVSRHLYACPNVRARQQVVRLDRIQNAFFRGPGVAPGSFAVESAMDELAWRLGLDPLELRLRNEPDRDPASGRPFTSRHLREAYELGAEAFGWPARPDSPRALREGHWLVGYGMSAAINPDALLLAGVTLRLAADGTVTISSATNELGAGTSTAQSQAAAQRLGLPLDRIRFEQGDSDVAATRVPGASAATTTLASAVWAACDKLVRELLALARGADSPLAGRSPDDVETRDGGLYVRGEPRGESYERILARAGREAVTVGGRSAPPYQTIKRGTYSYGAHFCEVRVDELTGEVRVTRWVGAFDGGRIVNPKQATSQMRGGIIMGIGMALTEEAQLDERTGRIVNRSLADYHLPTHADVPDIDIRFVDRPDRQTPLGAKGIGELGIVGAAAAIANAVYHATGRRVRSLPITPDKVM